MGNGNTLRLEGSHAQEYLRDEFLESAITPFDIRNGVILTKRSLSMPELTY